MSARRMARVVTVGVMAVLAGVTLLAQRGGGFGGGSRFTGLNPNVEYDGKFVFVRMSYAAGFGGRQGPPWSHDYPVGEAHFMRILTAVSNVPAHLDGSNVLPFDSPEIFKFPLIYLVEPGYWRMSDADVTNLRAYLLKGGFLVVDDFPGWAWPNFEEQMARVFPSLRWQDLTADHAMWHAFFEIPSLEMTTYYDLGGPPIFRALFEENDPAKRMYVVANYQNDVSEYWEFSESGIKPVDENNEAYKFGVNEFMYGITH